MTCIVGLVHDGVVHMGGDSLGANLWFHKVVRKDPKVFVNGDFLFGFCGSFRMGQLLAHAFKPPRRHPDDDPYKFLVTEFIDNVRKCLKDGGYARIENNVEEGGTFLLGYAGRLFRIEDDFQVGEPADGYDACGCGEDLARGALHALMPNAEMSPATKLRIALEAAQHHSAGVSAPFTFLKLPAAETAAA